ncbi:hypothetical protein Phage2-1_00110 [Achromobacter phage 2-1]|nr:hypothetical protein Phage2-1_00110 [Achromobacter phage 2-1]
MKKLELEIEGGNAAFEDEPQREVARILRDLAERIELTGLPSYVPLFDVNGNRVGKCTSTLDD